MGILDWLRGKKSSKVNQRLSPTERGTEGMRQFIGNLNHHLQRVRRDMPTLISFLDQYFGPDQIAMLAPIAVEKMNLTLSDGQEHSFAIFHAPVCYQICTLPLAMNEARDWFVRRYGGYTKLLERSWNVPHFQGSGCTVLCHIVYGWTRKGTWVHMAICPVDKSAPINTMIVPIEFLTPEERRVSGL